MSGGVAHLITSGPVLLAIPVAAAAGAITFLSPCCLPLVPGYLSYVTGMSGTAADADSPADSATPDRPAYSATPDRPADSATPDRPADAAGVSAGTPAAAAAGGSSGGSVAVTAAPVRVRARPRSRVMLGTLLFILGFSALFAVEGIAVSSIGIALQTHADGLSKILGVVIILLGLMFMGAFDRFSFAGRIFRPSYRPRAGLAGAPLLGVMFGLSWTPCIGPTLAAVLVLGENSGTALRGGLLAFVYALGLGIPFLIVAFAFQRGVTVFGWARRHARLITRIGGVMLIAVGVLEVTGAWASAIQWLQTHWLSGYTTPI
jgi:cytochrome c-type biogenesis protein